LGATISKWLGSGDYTLSCNSLVTKAASSSVPMMHKSGQTVVIRHREYIKDVYSGNGTPTTFYTDFRNGINPGLGSVFPWLSTVAQQFQEYTFRGLVFHFISTSGQSVASTNTALGNVMMATQYRFTDNAFTNKVALLNEYYSTDSKPSECFCHPIECDPKENPYNIHYVRTSGLPVGADYALYDIGNFTFATQGMPSSKINLGELWCTYEIELRKPVEVGFRQTDTINTHYYCATSVSTTNPFGTAFTSLYDTIGVTITNNTITFPLNVAGTFLVGVWHDTTTALDGVAVAATNCVHQNLATRNSSASDMFFKFSGATVISGGPTDLRCYTIPDPLLQASLVYSYSTLTTTGGVDIWIWQIADINVAASS